MTDNIEKIVQEAECVAAADEYFKARAWIMDTNDNRRIFEAGFDRAYALLSKLRTPVADELPHWEEISAKLERDETLTPLELFIHENEPAGGDADAWRDQLAAALASAPVAGEAQLSDEEIIADMERRGWRHLDDEERTDIIQFARALLSRYAAPQASEAKNYPGDDVAERLDNMADDQPPGSQAQSDLYAAATIWRKHIAHRAAPQASEAVRNQWPTDWAEQLKGEYAQGLLDGQQQQASEAVRNARAEGFLAGLDQALEVLEHDDFATRLQSAQVIRTLKSQSSALSAQPELSSGAPNGRKRTAAERRAPMVERAYGAGVTAQPAQKGQSDA